jgi:hypothetical protein
MSGILADVHKERLEKLKYARVVMRSCKISISAPTAFPSMSFDVA